MTTFLLHRHRRHHRPPSTRTACSLEGFMASFISGIGSFITDTIVAILRAIPRHSLNCSPARCLHRCVILTVNVPEE